MFRLSFEFAIGTHDRGKDIDLEKQGKAAESILQVHQLRLKNQAFERLSQEVRHEIRDHVEHLKKTFGRIELHDRDENRITVERTDDTTQVLPIFFDFLQHHIVLDKNNDPTVHLIIRVARIDGDRVIYTVRNAGQELGEMPYAKIITLVRHAIEALTKV